MIRAVLFDFDGLLVDSESIFFGIYRDMLAGVGREFTLADYLSGVSGRPISEIVADSIANDGLNMTVEEACAHVGAEEVRARALGVPLRPKARELLDHLRENGYPCAVTTSSPKERALAILESHGLADRFAAGVFAEDVTRGKPDPQVFLLGASRLGVDPAECLVLEDSEMGLEAAHAAGIPVICVPDKKIPDEVHRALATEVLSDLEKVIGFLEVDRRAAGDELSTM